MRVELAIINLTTGAVVRSIEIYEPVGAAKKVFDRNPGFAKKGLVSWANVELHHLEPLMLNGEYPDQEGFDVISQWSTEYSSEDYFWSLYFDEKENF